MSELRLPSWYRIGWTVGSSLVKKFFCRDHETVVGLVGGEEAATVSYQVPEFQAQGKALVLRIPTKEPRPVVLFSPSTQGMAAASDPSASSREGVRLKLWPRFDAVLAYEHPVALMMLRGGADVIMVDHPRDRETGVQLYCDHDAAAAALYASYTQACEQGLVSSSTPLGLWGFSQGGGAAAAALMSAAPQVRVGVVGAPPVHLREVLHRIDGTSATGLIAYAIAGLAVRTKELKREALGGLNRRGRRIVDACVNQCATATVLRYGTFDTSHWTINRQRLEMLFVGPPALRAEFARLRLDDPARPAPPTGIPIKLWATRFDTLMPFGSIEHLSRIWQDAGVDVLFEVRGRHRIPGRTTLNHMLPYYHHARRDIAWMLGQLKSAPATR